FPGGGQLARRLVPVLLGVSAPARTRTHAAARHTPHAVTGRATLGSRIRAGTGLSGDTTRPARDAAPGTRLLAARTRATGTGTATGPRAAPASQAARACRSAGPAARHAGRGVASGVHARRCGGSERRVRQARGSARRCARRAGGVRRRGGRILLLLGGFAAGFARARGLLGLPLGATLTATGAALIAAAGAVTTAVVTAGIPAPAFPVATLGRRCDRRDQRLGWVLRLRQVGNLAVGLDERLHVVCAHHRARGGLGVIAHRPGNRGGGRHRGRGPH